MPKFSPDLSCILLPSNDLYSVTLRYLLENGMPTGNERSSAQAASGSDLFQEAAEQKSITNSSAENIFDTSKTAAAFSRPSTSTAPSESPSVYATASAVEANHRTASGQGRKSSIERAMEKAKAKLGRRPSGSESLPDDEEDFKKQQKKAIEKQKRKEEYERLGLGDQTKFGMRGAGGWSG